MVKELPSNSKRKAKRLLVHLMLIFEASQPLVSCQVVMPLPVVNINRLSPMHQDRLLNNKNYYPKIAPTIISKPNKMILTELSNPLKYNLFKIIVRRNVLPDFVL